MDNRSPAALAELQNISDVAWLGEIPKHWGVERSKWLFSERKEKARKGDRQLTASQKYGMIFQDEYMEREGRRLTQVELNYEILKRVEAGDFVMSMRSFQGGLEYSAFEGSCSSAYVALIPNKKYVHPEFFRWLLKSSRYISALSGTSNLVRDGQALRFDNFSKVSLPVIPLDEQAAIARFIASKVEKIDLLIDKKTVQIKSLERYRRSLLGKMVRGGLLGEDVEKKETGIDWISEIPSHWKVLPGLRAFKEKKESNKGMKSRTVLSLSYGKIVEKSEEKMHGLMPESFETYQVVSPGDIIIRCTDLQNDKTSLRTGIAKSDGIITSAYLNLNSQEGFYPDYLHLYLHYVDISKVIYKLGSGLRQNLSWIDFKHFPIISPPLEEQLEILRLFEKSSERIDEAIAKQVQQTERLVKYRGSLIDAAVTGQLAVV